jgi:hypothetical protein
MEEVRMNDGEELKARIARKAYELFEQRGGGVGREVEDWLQAERIIKDEIEQPRDSPREKPVSRRSRFFNQ